MSNTVSLNHVLYKEKFYDELKYVEKTKSDFASDKLLSVHYEWNTTHKVIRIAKQILSIVIFPIALHKIAHALIGKVIVPASLIPSKDIDNARKQVEVHKENTDWRYYRFTLKVDGYKIDAVLMGTEETLRSEKRRWTLASFGNGSYYEQYLTGDSGFGAILQKTKSNAILFNYSGVGASSSFPNQATMAKTYRAMLTLLENEIEAKEIIGYGHSIGAGVQGQALKKHKLKHSISYVFVKNKTFSDLTTTISKMLNGTLGFLAKVFGWDMSSLESSKNLLAPEIIVQAMQGEDGSLVTEKEQSPEIVNSDKCRGSVIIDKDASLAKGLFIDKTWQRKADKTFIRAEDDRDNHNYMTRKQIQAIANQIEIDLQKEKKRKSALLVCA